MQPSKPDCFGDGLPTANADVCPVRTLPTAAKPITSTELARKLKEQALGQGGEE